MAATSFLFYADLQTRKISTTAGGTNFSFPTFTAGEDLSFGVRFTQTFAGTTTQLYPTVQAVRAAIGRSDTAPTGGTWELSVDGHGPTSVLSSAIAASDLQTAINAILPSGLTCSVTLQGISYVITFSDGATHAITASAVALDPASVVRIRTASNGSQIEHEVTLVQAPVAATDTFASIVAPAPSVTRIQAGSTDSSGQFRYPEVQDLYIPPTFQGTFALTFNGAQTTTLSDQSGTSDIATALNALWNGTGQTVSVSNPRTSVAEITFDGAAFIGSAEPLIGVVILSSPPGDPTCSLSLDTPGVFELLRANDTDKTCYLEIEVDLLNPDSTVQTVTLLRQQVTIQRSVNWSGLEAATPINWAVPVGPSSYLPFSPNQVITGSQYYATPIGDGTASSFVITHNLGTTDLHLTLQDSTTHRFLVNGTDYTATATSGSVVTIVLSAVPAVNGVRAIISTAGPTSAFVSNLTISPSQVTGLAQTLQNFSTTLTAVSNLLPSAGVGTTSSSANSTTAVTVPFSLVSEVIGYTGTASAAATGTGYLSSSLPHRAPSLLTPATFDRILWSLPVNPQMFAVGRTLEVDWGVSLQALRANCRLAYNLVVEVGAVTEGSNLTVAWNTSSPVFTQPIVLSEELVVHSFGLSLQRLASSITLSQQLYGIWSGNNTAAPASANFMLRCRLTGLETEASAIQPDPRAWISYALVPSTTNPNVTVAQASISS